jgi:hypothetical protein
MLSVCIDIFKVIPTTYEKVDYDCFVMCVDRLSGWMIVRPTLSLGLTGEKTAKLLLQNGWETFGLPSVITSDQGPQFIADWWKTMCNGLGIRLAYSQAYRPQGNGRAERAGKQLLDVLKKLSAETDINWVEALPRAIMCIHDTPGPAKLSPFQIMFGRDRHLGGVAYRHTKMCEDAEWFLRRMKYIDQKVSGDLNELHEKECASANKKRKERCPFLIGEEVLLIRPVDMVRNKLDSYWMGPYKVISRTSTSSYVVAKGNQKFKTHLDHMKPFHDQDVRELLENVTYEHRPKSPTNRTPKIVDKVLKHRVSNGEYEFLIAWENKEPTENTWEKTNSFAKGWILPWVEYCEKHAIPPSI